VQRTVIAVLGEEVVGRSALFQELNLVVDGVEEGVCPSLNGWFRQYGERETIRERRALQHR